MWGSTYLAIRVADRSLPPFEMAAIRYLTAGVVLYPLAWLALRHRRQAPGSSRRAQWAGIATGQKGHQNDRKNLARRGPR